ncbi:MAG: putative nucleotidyltransferase substrate binding domain-containing protein [Corynebacterium sp.]|nr:putative nucleotidyltransferase substrate binding domain-containing protein [Corynebacterium sp.]
MLHASLIDLGEQASHCEDEANARGVLREALDLARNAADHNADPIEVAAWLSQLVKDVLSSPAITSNARLAGAFGRKEGLPSSPLVLVDADSHLVEFFQSAGYNAKAVELNDPHSIEAIIARADLGEPLTREEGKRLADYALEHRPPALQVQDGLPSKESSVDIHADLIVPVVAMARWAAIDSGVCCSNTMVRLNEQTSLLAAETDSLREAWRTGMALQLANWSDKIHVETYEEMSQIQRAQFGASARAVADTIRAVADRLANNSF